MAKSKKKIIKQYKEGDRGLQAYMQRDTPIVVLKIVDAECVFCLYKWWNPYKQLWIYEGRKFTELLFWNSLVYGLTNEERIKLLNSTGSIMRKSKDTNTNNYEQVI